MMSNIIIKGAALREKILLSKFFRLSRKTFEKFSLEYATEYLVFLISKTMELPDRITGYHWARKNKNLLSGDFPDFVRYYCPSGEETKASHKDLQALKR